MSKAKEIIPFNRIKELMNRKRAQEWLLAIYMDVTTTTVSSWCTNKTQPSDSETNHIKDLLQVNLQKLVVKTNPPGHMHLAEAMKKAAAQFEKKHGSAYEVKVSKAGNESKTLNPKLKTLLRGIVEQFEKDRTLPK